MHSVPAIRVDGPSFRQVYPRCRNGPSLALENEGLDVFNAEPEIRPEYRKLPNVFHLPHLGAATSETRTRMATYALDNLDAVLAGKTPEDLLTVAERSSN